MLRGIVTEPLGRDFLAAPKALAIRWQQRAAAALKDFSPEGFSSQFVFFFFLCKFIEGKNCLSKTEIEPKKSQTQT